MNERDPESTTLQPGDRVVEHAALAISASIATGAASAPVCVWMMTHDWAKAAGAAAAGAGAGVLVGRLTAKRYRCGGQTLITRVGPGAFASVVQTALLSEFFTAILVWLVVSLLWNAELGRSFSMLCMTQGCGSAAAFLVAWLSTRS